MTTSIELGRIFGIRIGINWSWLVVLALILWTLASGIFPETNPGLSDGTYLAMAIAASVLFFSSLLLHELGHAVQARREGMEIEGITLWLFGGVAKFKGMFPGAGAEFRIAIAGPLVSLGLGRARPRADSRRRRNGGGGAGRAQRGRHPPRPRARRRLAGLISITDLARALEVGLPRRRRAA